MASGYLGPRDGLDWFDTEHGPMGVPPDIGGTLRGQMAPMPGAAAPDQGSAQVAPSPLAGLDPMAQPSFASPTPTFTDNVLPADTVAVPNSGLSKRAEAKYNAASAKENSAVAQQQQQAQQMGGFDGSFESAIGRQGQAMDAQGRAIAEGANLEAQVADEQSRLMQEGEQKRLEIEAKQEAARAEEAQKVDGYRSEIAKMVDEHTKMEVDRGRLWKNSSTGSKIGMALSVAMAGLGSAMKRQGDKNPALDIVMAAINNDVNDQMSAIEKSGTDVKMRQGMFQEYQQQLGNNEAARNAAMARGVASVEQQLKLAMAKTGSRQAIVNGQNALAEFGMKRAGFEMGAAQALNSRDQEKARLAQAEAASRRQVGLGYSQLKENRRQHDMEFGEGVRRYDEDMALKVANLQAAGKGGEAKALEEETAKVRQLGVFDTGANRGQPLKMKDGSTFLAGDPKRAQEIGKKLASTQSAVEISDDIKRMQQKYGPKWFSLSEGQQWMQSKSGVLTQVLKNAFEAGALDEGLVREMAKITGGDPTKLTATQVPLLGSVLSGSPTKAGYLDSLTDSLIGIANNDLASIGYDGRWEPLRSPTSGPIATQDEEVIRKLQEGKSTLDGAPGGFKGAVDDNARRNVERLAAAARQGSESAIRSLIEAQKIGGGVGKLADDAISEITFGSADGGNRSPVGPNAPKLKYPEAAALYQRMTSQ